jgi:ATP-dependent Zn protease
VGSAPGRDLTPGADPVRKVLIIPRGRALGVTFQAPDTDRYGYSEQYLRGPIAVLPPPGQESPLGLDGVAPATRELVDREVRRIVDECRPGRRPRDPAGPGGAAACRHRGGAGS